MIDYNTFTINTNIIVLFINIFSNLFYTIIFLNYSNLYKLYTQCWPYQSFVHGTLHEPTILESPSYIDDDDVPPHHIQYLCRHFVSFASSLPSSCTPLNSTLHATTPFVQPQPASLRCLLLIASTTATSPFTKLYSCRALLCLSFCALRAATFADRAASAGRSSLPLCRSRLSYILCYLTVS